MHLDIIGLQTDAPPNDSQIDETDLSHDKDERREEANASREVHCQWHDGKGVMCWHRHACSAM